VAFGHCPFRRWLREATLSRAAWVTADFDASERLKDEALVTQAPNRLVQPVFQRPGATPDDGEGRLLL
jgi:hypothetical protein